MIADLKPYAAYKESGLPWLGQVPWHWEVRRLKQIARFAYGDALPRTGRTEGKIPVFGSNGRIGWHSDSNTTAPCLIIGRKGSFGKVNFCNEPGFVIDTAFFIDDRLTKADLRWLYYTLGWVRLDGVSKDSAIPGLDREDAHQKMAAFPPPDEQAAIVRFLDWANGRLERAIRAKRKVIALLNEQKQAIIHRAVTRGLDPNVPLKPSGIPWLGEMPAHWEVRRLGSLLRERGEGNDKGAISHVLSLLRGRGIIPYDEKGNIGNKKSEDITRYKIVRPDDIVLNCMNVIIGSVGISRYTGCLSPVYYVLVRRNEANHPDYLNAIFQCSSFHRSLVRIGNGILAHRMRIPMELLKCELLPCPPCAEQSEIVEGLLSTTDECDVVINRAEREITLLREYRTRLVADVVTGKLDVRAAAAALPDEAHSGDESALSVPEDEGFGADDLSEAGEDS